MDNPPSCTTAVGHLFNLGAVVRQAFPAIALFHGCHTANNGSSAVLTLDHGIVALLETCQTDVSRDLCLGIANIALRELIVCRIVGLFNQLRLRNPRSEACAFDIDTG